MSEKPDDTIRKQVVRQIIDALGGQGIVACAYHQAAVHWRPRNTATCFPTQPIKEANVSRTQVVFDQEKHSADLRRHGRSGLGDKRDWAERPVLRRFVQPDDTYSVFLIRKRRWDAVCKDRIQYVLIDEAHDVYSDVLKGVVKSDVRQRTGKEALMPKITAISPIRRAPLWWRTLSQG